MEFPVNGMEQILEKLLKPKTLDRIQGKSLNSLEIHKKLKTFIRPEGMGLDGVQAAVEFYQDHAINTTHPLFMNQLWAGLSQSGVIAETLGALWNTSMYTSEVAPVATIVEVQAIQLLGQLAGFKEPEGTFVPGASYGNMMAVMMGRDQALPHAKEKGITEPLALFCSKDCHYSFVKAANICGLGQESVYKVEANESGQMDMKALSLTIEKAKAEGRKPFFVGLTAGTTVRGAFDNINEAHKICQKNSMWLHVDGALGGTFVFSDKLKKEFLPGLEMADSFILNLHKMLGAPLHCSAFLSRHPGRLQKATSLSSAETAYLFHEEGALDLGLFSLQCGRKADVLKFWLALVEEGVQGFAQRLERIVSLARYAEEKIKSHSNFQLIVPRSSVTVCFNWPFENPEVEREMNERVRAEIIESKDIYINYGWVHGKMAWRVVPFNSALQESDIDRAIELIEQKFLKLTS